MELYLIVYEMLDGEPDWFLIVLEHYPSTEEQEKLVEDNYKDVMSWEDGDGEFELNSTIGSIWCNEVKSTVDESGNIYNIKIEADTESE